MRLPSGEMTGAPASNVPAGGWIANRASGGAVAPSAGARTGLNLHIANADTIAMLATAAAMTASVAASRRVTARRALVNTSVVVDAPVAGPLSNAKARSRAD